MSILEELRARRATLQGETAEAVALDAAIAATEVAHEVAGQRDAALKAAQALQALLEETQAQRLKDLERLRGVLDRERALQNLLASVLTNILERSQALEAAGDFEAALALRRLVQRGRKEAEAMRA